MLYKKRLLLFSASLVLYIIIQFISCTFFNTWRGEAIVIPVIISGILFGLKPVIIITLLLQFPLNLLLCLLFQINIGSTVLSGAGISGGIAILLFGCVIGYIRNINIQRQKELKQLEVAETQLTAYRSRLESMVDEKTAELSKKILELEIQDKERIRLTKIIEQASEPIMIMDPGGTLQYVNPAVTDLTGYTLNEILGQNIFKASQKSRPKMHQEILSAIKAKKVWTQRLTHRKKDGEVRVIKTSISPVFDASRELVNLLSIGRDVTKEIEMENKLRQAQKMESIGTLAGGIAHDFNNILSIILGYTELTINDVKKDPKTRESLNQVLLAVSRAKDLVSQILTFSRSHDVQKLKVQTIPIIKEVCKFMRSSLPTTIEIEQDIQTEHDLILADPTQLQQVLMNLCTNAGHAMLETGGVLHVQLAKTSLYKDDLLAYPNLKPGSHLKISVRDTGHGISKENLHRIFDPYFTTKEPSKGTGLGLSVVHGIVKDCGGDIKAYSTVGQGTVFHVLFPLITETARKVTQSPEQPPHGTEAIMFVDDEEVLVTVSTRMLERLGYKVTGFTNPEEALAAFNDSKDSYDLIITDKTMPKITGLTLAEEIKKIRADIPILLCTGFQDKDLDEKAHDAGVTDYIIKPLNNLEMAVAVRKVLDKNSA